MLQEWPQEVYPPYANGPGYVISSDIAKFIVLQHGNQSLRVCNTKMLLSISFHLDDSFRRFLFCCYILHVSSINNWNIPFLFGDSSSRWRMWVWECGLNNLIVPWLYGTLTAGSFVSMDAWKVTTLHITNPRGRWSAFGTSCQEVGLIAATLDDKQLLLPIIVITFLPIALPVFVRIFLSSEVGLGDGCAYNLENTDCSIVHCILDTR